MFVVITVRFQFFDGKKNYTVEYNNLHKWFIFKDDERTGALSIFQADRGEGPTAYNAGCALERYLDTLQK